eukprot:3982782-Pyramimonas_sp.AAC.1
MRANSHSNSGRDAHLAPVLVLHRGEGVPGGGLLALLLHPLPRSRWGRGVLIRLVCLSARRRVRRVVALPPAQTQRGGGIRGVSMYRCVGQIGGAPA